MTRQQRKRGIQPANQSASTLTMPQTSSVGQSPEISPSDLASSITPRSWARIGVCFYCREALEAMQPGGNPARHVSDQVPYEQCQKALKYKGETK